LAYVSSMLFSCLDLVSAVREVASLGFRRVELSHVHLERLDPSAERVASEAMKIREIGVDTSVAHLPADRLSTRVSGSGGWRRCFERLRVFVEVLHRVLGANVFVVHPLLPEPQPNATSYRYAKLSEAETRSLLRAMDSLARDLGIHIAVENRVERYAFGNPIGDLLSVIDGLDRVGLCIDVGHANASGMNPVEVARLARDRTIAYHLHDNDGSRDQHLLPYLGVIPWSEVIKELNPSAALVFEVSCSSKPEVCRSYGRYLSMFIDVMSLQRAER